MMRKQPKERQEEKCPTAIFARKSSTAREINAHKAGKVELNTHGSRPDAELVRAQEAAMERTWGNKDDDVWNDL